MTCSSSSAVWREQIDVTAKGGIDRRPLFLRLDPEAEPPAGGGLVGHVLAYNDDGELGSTSLTVRPGSQSVFVQALEWCFGFALPALFGLLLAQLALMLQAHRQSRDDFHKFRALEVSAIAGVIESLKTVRADTGIKRPGRIVYENMKNAGVLENLPADKRRYLVDLCYRNNMEDIVALMRTLFPEQATELH